MENKPELISDQAEEISGGAEVNDTYKCSLCGQLVPVSQVKIHLKVCLGNRTLNNSSQMAPESAPNQ